jgi:hypothetical protein
MSAWGMTGGATGALIDGQAPGEAFVVGVQADTIAAHFLENPQVT